MVTYHPPEPADGLTWRLSWSSDQPAPLEFRVYREGRLAGRVRSTDGRGAIVLAVAPGEYPFLEVLDRAAQIPQAAFPGRLELHWLAVAGAARYRIEELVSGVWTARATRDDDGAGAFTWRTRWLPDATTHSFRVVPLDAAGNAGSALTFAVLQVRHPDQLAWQQSFNAGTGRITISAA